MTGVWLGPAGGAAEALAAGVAAGVAAAGVLPGGAGGGFGLGGLTAGRPGPSRSTEEGARAATGASISSDGAGSGAAGGSGTAGAAAAFFSGAAWGLGRESGRGGAGLAASACVGGGAMRRVSMAGTCLVAGSTAGLKRLGDAPSTNAWASSTAAASSSTTRQGGAACRAPESCAVAANEKDAGKRNTKIFMTVRIEPALKVSRSCPAGAGRRAGGAGVKG